MDGLGGRALGGASRGEGLPWALGFRGEAAREERSKGPLEGRRTGGGGRRRACGAGRGGTWEGSVLAAVVL